MAYAAVISLKRTIEGLIEMHSWCYVTLSDSSEQIIQLVKKELDLLEKALEELDGNVSNRRTERLNGVDGEIREAVSELEDKLDSLVVSHIQFSSPREVNYTTPMYRLLIARFSQRSVLTGPHGVNDGRTEWVKARAREAIEAVPELERPFIMDLEPLKQDIIDNFTQRVGKLKAAYAHEFRYPSPQEEEEEEEDDDHHLGGNEYSEMVGLSKLYIGIRGFLMREDLFEMVVTTLWGMTGLGKTTLAKKLLHDPLVLTRFNTRVFVSIGPGYKLEDVLLDILKQVKNPEHHQDLLMEGDAKLDALKRMIQQGLKSRRYFVVLDDLWDKDLWYRHLGNLFTSHEVGSHVLVTTTLKEVADIGNLGCKCPMPFLDKQESLDLLREKVFGKECIPRSSYRLEKALEKIAENCEGLPLTIVMVGNILSKKCLCEKTSITYLSEVAADKHHPVFIEAYDQMFKLLYPNYNYLPQRLKPCFLYIAVFPQNHEYPKHLTDLWYAEGFFEPGGSAEETGVQLKCRSLLMPTDTLHAAFWHMCKKIAATDKFFHCLNTVADALAEDVMESQRRLCIHNNVLFGIQYANDSMVSVSNLRSLLCSGPYHQYPVPICLESWRLLSILHAIKIRFYEFPMQVMKLIQLRYIALTYDGNIPSLIFRHWSLQYLIVQRHLKIVESDRSLSFLPTEIWDMTRLFHLEVMGSNLPRPPHEQSLLLRLSVLCDVGAQSCTKDVFERMPNLTMLGIQIELAPNAADEPLRVFDHISHLSELQLLKCVIENPVFKPACTALAPLSVLPSILGKLVLSGLGYPWEEMSKISSLPNLTHLVLKCYAFRGPRWEVRDKGFRQLKVLDIEDTDLVQWTVEDCHSFEKLEDLYIKHCYKLKEVHLEFGVDIDDVGLFDCNPLAVSCVEQLKVDFDRKYMRRRPPFKLTIQSSWDK